MQYVNFFQIQSGNFEVQMKANAKIISCGIRDGIPVFYHVCDAFDNSSYVTRKFVSGMSGSAVPDNAVFVGSYQRGKPYGWSGDWHTQDEFLFEII